MRIARKFIKQSGIALLVLVLTAFVVQSTPVSVHAAGYATFANPANRGESVRVTREAYMFDLELSDVTQGDDARRSATFWIGDIPAIPAGEEFYFFSISCRVYETAAGSYPISSRDLKVYTEPDRTYQSNTLQSVPDFDFSYELGTTDGWRSDWMGVVAPKGCDPYIVYESPVDGYQLVWQIRSGYPEFVIASVTVAGGEEALVAGAPITLTASVSGGSNQWPHQIVYDYSVVHYREDGSWGVVAHAYEFDKNFTFVAGEAGRYDVSLYVYNGDEDAEAHMTLNVREPGPLAVAAFRAGWSDSYEPGETINLAARGEGGYGPYKYQFYVLRSNGARVNFRRTPVSSNIYPWTPVNPDTYTLGVDIYDTTGQKVTQEKTITVKSQAPLAIATFRAGWSNTYDLGRTIDLAARGEGGTGPYKYQFYVLRSNGARVNFRKTPVSSNIYPWTPVTPDTYTLGVDVHDATGRKVSQEKEITVKSPAPLSAAVFRAGWSNTYTLGQTIDLAARGEGGTGPYKYQFYVLRSNGNRVNFRNEPVSSNIYPWTPVNPDTYTLGVDIYDAAGQKVTEEKLITVLPGQ